MQDDVSQTTKYIHPGPNCDSSGHRTCPYSLWAETEITKLRAELASTKMIDESQITAARGTITTGTKFSLDEQWWTIYVIDRNTIWAYRNGHPGDVCDFTYSEIANGKRWR